MVRSIFNCASKPAVIASSFLINSNRGVNILLHRLRGLSFTHKLWSLVTLFKAQYLVVGAPRRYFSGLLILRVRGFFQLDGYSFRLMFGLSGFLYLSGLIQLILLQAEHRVADLQNFIIRLEIRGRSQ